MIRLPNTTIKLQIVLGGAVTTNQLKITCGWIDQNPQNEFTRGGQQQATSNSTTDVDLVSALGTGKDNYVRNIDSIFVYNRDTVSATVIIKTDDGGTEFEIVRRTLLTLETLAYEHGVGWYIMSVT